jgi:hypothetical protein
MTRVPVVGPETWWFKRSCRVNGAIVTAILLFCLWKSFF